MEHESATADIFGLQWTYVEIWTNDDAGYPRRLSRRSLRSRPVNMATGSPDVELFGELRGDTVIFVSRPRTHFFMQGHREEVGKKGFTAQTPFRSWLRQV